MHILLVAALSFLPLESPDLFPTQADLQGIYDEISQATLQFATDTDVDIFHGVFYTPDWVFVDVAGQTHSWESMRAEAIVTLQAPPPDALTQPIQKLALTPEGGATVTISATTVRTIVDSEGRYGRKGASHTLTEVTPFRDTWIKTPDGWRFKSRQQLSAPRVVVDKPTDGV